MRLVPTLYAERLDGHVRYRLEIPERDQGSPLQEEFSHPLDQGTLSSLTQSADALLRSEEAAGFPEEARRRGSVLYRTLVPVRLREHLKTLSGPLLISTSLLGVPWELLYDDEEFWGLRYAIGKRIMMNRPLTMGASVPLRSRPRALIVGSDPRGDLPFVRAEVERICETLERFTDICCVTGNLATFDAVTTYLREGFDLIHYCGHVLADRQGGPALLLADQTPLAAQVIERTLAGGPLVFLNGCASARGVEHVPTSSWEQDVSGVAYAFLFGGALGVVGTLCDVSDRHAATLAEAFYERVLTPLPVGEALRAARQRCRADPATAGSPTWLSFVLYGNPTQVLIGRGTEPVALLGPYSPPPTPSPDQEAAAQQSTRWRLLVPALVVLAFVAAAGFGLHTFRGTGLRGGQHQGPLVVGVMEVRARGGAVPDWMREVTREALNTILSKVPAVRVYSRQKIDFLREKRGLTEIEAAETLGMAKMIAATLSVVETSATLEVEVVDIATGILEASERAHGRVKELIEVQNQVAVKTLRALGVTPSDEELKMILANRTNETLESYKLLSETLGGGDAEPKTPAPRERPPGPTSLRSGAVAFAQEPSAEEKAIYGLLEQYRVALEHKDLDELAGIQADMTEVQRAALRRYFENARGLAVRISNVDIMVEGDDALATFTREDVFTDARSGRQLHLEVRINSVLGRQDGGWRIRTLRKPS